jgi:glutamate dehydrogenase
MPTRSKGQVARIVRGWSDELKQNLVGHYGEERGNSLLRRYSPELPLSYQERVTPASAVSDLERLEAAEQSGRVEVKLSAAQGDDGSHQHLKLFRRGRPRPLSAILPILENMGLTVLPSSRSACQEVTCTSPTSRCSCRRRRHWTTTRRGEPFIDLLEDLLRDQAENDGFNRLVLLAGLDGRQISILRAYSRYLRQAGLPFSQAYVSAVWRPISRLRVRWSNSSKRSFADSRRRSCESLADEVRRPCCRSAIPMMTASFGAADGHRSHAADERLSIRQ